MRTTGTVKCYDDVRGLGVIDRDDREEDCFFHSSATGGFEPLRRSERVEFDIVQTPEGLMATNVSVIRPAVLGGSRPRVDIRGGGPRRFLQAKRMLLRFGRL